MSICPVIGDVNFNHCIKVFSAGFLYCKVIIFPFRIISNINYSIIPSSFIRWLRKTFPCDFFLTQHLFSTSMIVLVTRTVGHDVYTVDYNFLLLLFILMFKLRHIQPQTNDPLKIRISGFYWEISVLGESTSIIP